MEIPTLPLSALDLKNNAPVFYIWVQDGLSIMVGILWVVAYVLYIRQGYRDQTYGMPLLSLCANLAWELVYGFFYPPGGMAELLTFAPFFIVDLGLVYMTLQFGPREWKQSSIVQNNLGLLLIIGSGAMTLGHWAFALLFDDLNEASYWSGFGCQLIVSWAAVSQLLSRASTRGHSMAIWWNRFLGTLCALLVFRWRVHHYPADYPYIHTAAANFLFASYLIGDLSYPFVFYHVRRLEGIKAKRG